jgi:hypothetical protein
MVEGRNFGGIVLAAPGLPRLVGRLKGSFGFLFWA